MLKDYWKVDPATEPELAKLLPIAGNALYEEDQTLRKAFNPKLRYAVRETIERKGLAYPVFETTLVYEIFKVWLPYVDIDWECPYRQCRGFADLVIWNGEVAQFVFEAKWWDSNSEAGSQLIIDDVVKLRKWPDRNARLIMLTFWCSPNTSENETEDFECLQRFCMTHGCRQLWHCTFPTHFPTLQEWLFTFAAIEVYR